MSWELIWIKSAQIKPEQITATNCKTQTRLNLSVWDVEGYKQALRGKKAHFFPLGVARTSVHDHIHSAGRELVVRLCLFLTRPSERERQCLTRSGAHVWRGSGTPMSIALTILTEGVRESVRVCIARTGRVARREKRRHGGHWRQAVSLGCSHGV